MNKPGFNCKSLIIGHRGMKGDIMENTLESILHAIDIGVDGVEFDIQRCYTGELILGHDKIFDRLAFKDQFYFNNVQGKPINKLQWYYIYNTELIDVMGRKYKIPKLVDVLRHPKVYNSDTLINIEIKDKTSHEILANLLWDLIDEGLYEPDRFLISSQYLDHSIYFGEFKEESLRKDLRYKNFKIGWISPETIDNNDLLNIIKSCSSIITHVVLNKSILKDTIINSIKQLELDIFCYTINSVSEYPIDNLENKIEGIITDKPSIFI